MGDEIRSVKLGILPSLFPRRNGWIGGFRLPILGRVRPARRWLPFFFLWWLVSGESSPAFLEQVGNYARSRTYDLQHIRLELSFDFPRKMVMGTATLTLSPLQDTLSSVILDAVDLQVESVEAGGVPLKYQTDEGKLTIALDRPFASGETITLSIRYSAQPRAGLYFILPEKGYPNRLLQVWSQGERENNRYWFPVYDYPNDFATSEVIATVPKPLRVISNGKLLEVKEEGNQRTFHWLQDVPHATYLISIIVGEFEVYTQEWEGIPIVSYVKPMDVEKAQRSFEMTADMMEFFSNLLEVKYPWAQYAQTPVEDFIHGGMENISATTLNERVLLDERARPDFESEGLLAHELAHQWFGDLVTCKDWLNTWLNEGFATYFASLYKEYWKGKDEFLYERLGSAEGYFDEARRYKRPIVDYRPNSPFRQFDAHDYQKGSWILHMLRYELGDDLFFQALHHYLNTHRNKNVTTADLIQALEEATGKNFDLFFQQWVFSPGHPELKISFDYDDSLLMAHLNIQQVQKTDDGTPIFRFTLPVEFWHGEESFPISFRIEKKEQDVYVPLAHRPEMVLIDPDLWILKTVDFPKGTSEWLVQLKRAPNAVSRLEALRALKGKWNDPGVIPALIETLKNPQEFYAVRAEAAELLGTSGRDDALQALKESLNEPDSRVRKAIVSALGNFPKEKDLPDRLKKILRQDVSYAVQASAISALAKLDEKKHFDILKDALKYDSHQEVVRQAVFSAFTTAKEERAIPLLKEWSKYGKPIPVRSSAISALSKLGIGNKEVREHLLSLLDDPLPTIRMDALTSLGVRGEEEALESMQRVADKDPDPRVRDRAQEAIKALQATRAAKPELAQLKQDIQQLQEKQQALEKLLSQIEEKLKALAPPSPDSK